jgi:hypothetical protein
LSADLRAFIDQFRLFTTTAFVVTYSQSVVSNFQIVVEADRSKQIVIALLDTIGFDAIDAGSLSESWRCQRRPLVLWARAGDEDVYETASSLLPAWFVGGVKDADEGTDEVVGIRVLT